MTLVDTTWGDLRPGDVLGEGQTVCQVTWYRDSDRIGYFLAEFSNQGFQSIDDPVRVLRPDWPVDVD